mgnify:CR=1 FL=1
MPRTRLINPSFFLHEDLGRCTAHARLLFVALWTQADKLGRLRWLPLKVHGESFPHEPGVNVTHLAQELVAAGVLSIYEASGRRYAHLPGFKTWQRPHRNEQPSACPAPPDEILAEDSLDLLILESMGKRLATKDNQGSTKGSHYTVLPYTDNRMPLSSPSSSMEEDSAQRRRGDLADAAPYKPRVVLKTPTGDDTLDFLLETWPTLLGKHDTLERWLATSRDAFPGIDLLAEARRASAWQLGNPANKKRQVRAFLTRWWGKAQDNGPRPATKQSSSASNDDAIAMARSLGAKI